MRSVLLKLEASGLNYFCARWSEKYPRRIILYIEASYEASLSVNNREIPYDGSFYVVAVEDGWIRISSTSGKSVEIGARAQRVWYRGERPYRIRIISEPISLEELHEINEKLGAGDTYTLYWEVIGYGFLKDIAALGLNLQKNLLVAISISSYRSFSINRQDFVKKILEPTDMLKREYIEVIIEPLDKTFIDKIKDQDIRDALRILLEKQKFLYDALLQLRKATSSLEYSNVITSVRKAVELLEPNKPAGNMLMNALRKSYSLVNIAEDIDARASAELIEELIETLIGSNGFLTNIFKYSSKLGPHVKTASGKLCKPHPYKMDAEFAILQAMVTLNYMIRLLKNAAIRT